MAKDKKCECEAGAPAWVVTYGDLMSLLMTFFVLLLSFATMEEPKRYTETLIAIQGAFGVMPKEQAAVQINPLPRPMKAASRRQEDVARNVRRMLQVQKRQDDVKIEYDSRGGVKISLPTGILFGPGEARLQPQAYPMLDELAGLLAEYPEAFFEVRGHTDNTPLGPGTGFRDNYDLSYSRADSVARFLNRTGRIPMEQFQIISCGAGEPLAPNTSPEAREANRRVEIFVRGLLTKPEATDLRQRVRTLTNP